MPPVSRPDPAADAAALLADVQRRALHGLVLVFLFCTLLQLVLWHAPKSLSERTLISLGFETILVLGVGAQFLVRHRWSLRANGQLFIVWLGAIDTLGWLAAGPNFGIGIVMVCTILVAIFFVGPRAGGFVLGGFAAMMVAHAVLHRYDFYLTGSVWLPQMTTASILRASVGGLGPLVVCYVGFSMIHRALFRALDRITAERRKSDAADLARERTEDILHANQHFEALGKLSSGVAHDVNNALTTILCNADFLRESLPPASVERRCAEDILSAGASAAQTTRHLLNLSRRAFCTPVPTVPAHVVASVTRLTARLIPSRIRVVVSAQTERSILVDPADLQQALLNLLINCRDAIADDGSVSIEVLELPTTAEIPASSAPVRIAIRVRDTGRGIPANILPRIFDPFFTTKPLGQGTGLGLAMVKAFVEEAGGTVAVESTVGRGTCISLVFPECRAESALGDDRDETAPVSGGQSILLVENQDDLRPLMERMLGRGGYRVTAVATLEEALACLERENSYDLLCTDGLRSSTHLADVVARLRRDRPHAPVLLCSGHLTDELVEGELSLLQLNFLRKPFTGTELLAHVRRILRHRPLTAATPAA